MIGSVYIENLSGVRYSVSYLISGDEGTALSKSRDICYEQTVEFPEDLTPDGDIKEHIVGRIEDFAKAGEKTYRAVISFAVETTGNDLVQLLNVVFGNISIKPGIKVERLLLPEELLSVFNGPRFGIDGLRKRLKVFDRPLICTALKPMGLSPAQLADQAYAFASGGIDMIKDDHGLADQKFCPFEERVKRCAEAVKKANEETGKSCMYIPNITGPAHRVMERSLKVKELGAGALLACPLLIGIDTVRLLADSDDIGLPIMVHPSFSGSFVISSMSGISHFVLYGQIMRLAGADATVFPNYGGRFSFSREECSEIASGCSIDMGHIAAIFPSPGGGMTEDRMKDIFQVYGKEFIVLIGGGLHRRGEDLAESSRYFARMMESM